jgi:site-specific DNA-methyltransferase (adenine-specific)
MELDTVVCMEALDFLRGLPDGSVDCVVTDPPYGINLDDWDNPIQIDVFLRECYRVLKAPSFLVFFGQMPTMIDWIVSAQGTGWIYKDHIVWVKRQVTAIALPINRAHESIMVYRKGKPKYNQVKGRYEDVKLPGYLLGLIKLSSIERHMAELRLKANGGIPSKTGHRKTQMNQYDYMDIESSRSSAEINFTNVWSFYPEKCGNKNSGLQHPTIKPILLMERLVELVSNPGDLILDPFIGSGTTAVAARNLGRHYIGCDISEEYVAITNQRLALPFMPPLL